MSLFCQLHSITGTSTGGYVYRHVPWQNTCGLGVVRIGLGFFVAFPTGPSLVLMMVCSLPEYPGDSHDLIPHGVPCGLHRPGTFGLAGSSFSHTCPTCFQNLIYMVNIILLLKPRPLLSMSMFCFCFGKNGFMIS